MPSKRMVPEQEVSELSDEMGRLAAAKDAEIALLKADFQNASDAADAYCAEIARLRNTIGWEASVAYRAEIAALKAEVEIAEQNADRWADRYNEIWPKLDQVTEQRDRWKAIVEAACRFCVLNGTKKTQAHNDLVAAVQKLFEHEHGFASLDAGPEGQ